MLQKTIEGDSTLSPGARAAADVIGLEPVTPRAFYMRLSLHFDIQQVTVCIFFTFDIIKADTIHPTMDVSLYVYDLSKVSSRFPPLVNVELIVNIGSGPDGMCFSSS